MASMAGMGAGSDEQLKFRLSGLEHEVAKSAARVRRLGWLALALLLLLVALLIALYLYHVLQYARVNTVEAVPSPDNPGAAAISYTPNSSGKVEFVRKTQDLEETLTDYAIDPISSESKKLFSWSGAGDDRYDLEVTYREGLSLVTKPLLVSGKPPK
jgi:hypothetical protein